MTDRYATGEVYWRDPAVEPPPTATKLLLLTPGHTCVVGNWEHWCVAWSPMPKKPAWLRDKMLAGLQ